MKKINIVLMIMMMPCLLMQAAQESKSGYDSDTQSVQSFKQRRLDSGVDEQPVVATSVAVLATPFVDQERQDFINSTVKKYPALDEGLILLRKQGKKIPKLIDYLEANLAYDDQDADADVNQNKKEFGIIIEELEENIAKNMKSKFLEHVDHLILADETDSNSDSDEESTGNLILSDEYIGQDSVLQYLQEYQDGFMKPIVRNWINSKNDVGITPLFKAVQHEKLPICKALINLGADPNIQDKDGRTPLHESVGLSDVEMMTMLFKAGANLDIQDIHGKTAMVEAFMHDDIDSLNTLALLYNWGANPNLIDDGAEFYNQDVMIAMRNEYCDHNFDLEHAAYLKNYELRSAIMSGDISSINSLIAQGANVNFLPGCEYIKNVLYRKNMHPHVNEDLKFHDFKSNVTLAGALNGNIEITKILLQAGARPNKRSHRTGVTALFDAIEDLNHEYVKILIEYGADVNLIEEDGQTSLCEALHMFLIVSSMQYNQDDVEVAKEIISLLLQAGAAESLNIPDIEGTTSVITVVQYNSIDLLKKFLEYSPDLNLVVPDNDGDTPLHIAAHGGYTEIVRLLLAHQVDRTIVNNDGQTAFDVATTDEMRALLS